MNNKALNKAWVNKWKNANEGLFNPKAISIIPSWERVDRATTFFKSFSLKADLLASRQVTAPK